MGVGKIRGRRNSNFNIDFSLIPLTTHIYIYVIKLAQNTLITFNNSVA